MGWLVFKILAMLWSLTFLFLPTAEAEGAYDDALKIGCVTEVGDERENLIYRHYYRSFIEEIAKYTDRIYEVTELTPTEAADALATGRVDILFPAEKDFDENLCYSRPMGLNIVALFSRDTETRFSVRDMGTLVGATVGLLPIQETDKILASFLQEKGLALNLRYFFRHDELTAALASGEVDLILDTVTRAVKPAKHFLSVGQCPAYAVGHQAKQDDIKGLDEAYKRLWQNDPDYVSMRRAAFQHSEQKKFAHFTSEAAETIKNLPPLKIAVYGEEAPFFLFGEDGTPTGIFPDIMTELEKISGLEFTYVRAYTYEDAKHRLRMGEADLLLDIYNNDPAAADLGYTAPLFVQEWRLIGDKYQQDAIETSYRLVLPTMSASLKLFMAKTFPKWEIVLRPTAGTALDAVMNNEADLAVLEGIVLQTQRPLILYPELHTVPGDSIRLPISLAISPRQPPILQEVLNSAIRQLSPEAREEIATRNIMGHRPPLSVNTLLHHYPMQTGLVLGLILLVIASTGFLYHHSKAAKAQRNALRERNMHLEDALESIIEANKARDSYKQMAETCPLTGILNRAAIQRAGEKLFQNDPFPGHVHALLIADLDHFKEANDICGHQFGDKVLKEFAMVLRQVVRSEDLVGRFGGDEFIVILRDIHAEDAAQVAERINEAARHIKSKVESQPQITASIGIALCPIHGGTYEELFRAADRALYEVKEHGRDGYVVNHTKI
ncbi:MAG: diguanylate cyclase [Selenomonadaceae bacterium]|nr:diguanylate cyclase [Selenomonadaceae bacterium]